MIPDKFAIQIEKKIQVELSGLRRLSPQNREILDKFFGQPKISKSVKLAYEELREIADFEAAEMTNDIITVVRDFAEMRVFFKEQSSIDSKISQSMDQLADMIKNK